MNKKIKALNNEMQKLDADQNSVKERLQAAWKECKTMNNLKATVKWFNQVNGYGFLSVEGFDKDVFAHYSAIQGDGFKNLTEGQSVIVDLLDGPKGPQALAIRKV